MLLNHRLLAVGALSAEVLPRVHVSRSAIVASKSLTASRLLEPRLILGVIHRAKLVVGGEWRLFPVFSLRYAMQITRAPLDLLGSCALQGTLVSV